MHRFHAILVATDFSVDGNNAVRRAAPLAQQQGSRLHILHPLQPAGRQPLREWFKPAIPIDTRTAQARGWQWGRLMGDPESL